MQTTVPKEYLDYGRYINKNRSFAYHVDGCKMVERRILYTAYNIARDKFVKCAKVVGDCMGNLHPHGDCVSGNTPIALLDGSMPTIEWLQTNRPNDKFWVYSRDPKTGKIVPGLAHSPRIGQTTNIMYRITIDNNEVIECTEEHPFMLINCEYEIAKKLKVGQSLSPLRILSHKSHFNQTYNCISNKFIHTIVGEYFYGKLEKNEVFHHKDFNTENNDPSNILKCTRKEHHRLHFDHDQKFREIALNALDKGRDEMFSNNGKFRQKIVDKNNQLMTRVNHTLQLHKAILLVKHMFENKIELNEKNYNDLRPTFGYNYPHIKTLINKQYIIDFEDLISKSELNHKIINIEKIILDEPINFYDITVDKYHNFAIGQGVFVHNSSIYDSLVNLVNDGLMDKQGNFGNDAGIIKDGAAAYRYTECKSNKDVLKMAFEYINFVDFGVLELEEKEPLCLPTMLPLCLLKHHSKFTTGIGFGYASVIPCYTKKDLCKRLKWIIDGKKGKGPLIKPVSNCDNLSVDDEYYKLLTEGIASIEYRGKYDVDKKDLSVTIKSIPPKKSFLTILKKFKNDMEVMKTIGVQDKSAKETSVVFKILKPRSQKIEDLEKKIKECVTGRMSYSCYMCDTEGNVMILSVDDLLFNCYQFYKNTVEKYFKNEIDKINNRVKELMLILKIRPFIADEIKNVSMMDVSVVVDNVFNKLNDGTTKEFIKELFDKYTITKLFNIKTDTTELNNKLVEIKSNLNNIEGFIWSEKYSSL